MLRVSDVFLTTRFSTAGRTRNRDAPALIPEYRRTRCGFARPARAKTRSRSPSDVRSSKVLFYVSYVGLSGVLQGSDLDAIMSVGRAFLRKDAYLTRLGVCKRAQPLDGGVTTVKKYPRMVPYYMWLNVEPVGRLRFFRVVDKLSR